MSKRIRRRKPKRSKSGDGGQRAQKLSKAVRELYGAPGEAWETLERVTTAPAVRRPSRAGWQETPLESQPSAALERVGWVVSLASGAAQVELLDLPGQHFEASLPSRLAEEQQSSIAVGDRVRLSLPQGNTPLARVEAVLPRRTWLSRPDTWNPRQERVAAANVDVVVHVVSVVSPPLRLPLIDRYLIAIARGGARPLLCVNKCELLAVAELQAVDEQLAPWREGGLEVLFCSALRGDGVAHLRAALSGQTAVFVGHSGVGKSSLLNALEPGLALATAALSRARGKGRHTTTRAQMWTIAAGQIRVIDTPGVREFGLWRLEPAELRTYFADFAQSAASCRFSDCSHVHEPACGVRAAVVAGSILPSRYETYLRIRRTLFEPDPT